MRRLKAVVPESRLGIVSLWMMGLVGLLLLALLLLDPDQVFAGLDGSQPFNLHSPLRANYSADAHPLALAPLSMNLVGEAIADRETEPGKADEQATRVGNSLKTPVPTAGPYYTPTALLSTPLPGSPAPTRPGPTATPGKPTQTASLTPSATWTQIVSATPNVGILTSTPVTGKTLTYTVTPCTSAGSIPCGTRTSSPTPTLKPSLTNTWTPTRPWTPTPTPWEPTATPTPTDTYTPLPTKTPTPVPYPPPATPKPSGTPYP